MSDGAPPPTEEVPSVGLPGVVRFGGELLMLGVPGAGVGPAAVFNGSIHLGRFVAPRASRRLRDPARLALEAHIFAIAVAGLAWSDVGMIGAVLATAHVASARRGATSA